MGLLSGVGTLRETWAAALEGRAAAGAAEPPEPADVRLRRLDRAARFALAAAAEAWADAGNPDAAPERRAVLLGASRGGFEAGEKLRERRSPFDTIRTLPFSAAAAVSILLEARGPSIGLSSACASSAQAIGLGARLLQAGAVDVVLAGGAEACDTPGYRAMAERSGLLSPERCRPFDVRRSGTAIGEGAAFLVLERRERALARGARIRAELLGYGATSDADSLHAPAGDGAALAAAMREALREAGLAPEGVAWVKAHATGTKKGDEAEAKAIRLALGARADRVPVGSLKPVLGHALGASGALEAALVVAALQDRRRPPTANLERPDPALGLQVPRDAGPLDGAVLANSAGLGGANVCLAFGPGSA
jgi:3-oxoacyl-(acyl-carrier-protein) synthase